MGTKRSPFFYTSEKTQHYQQCSNAQQHRCPCDHHRAFTTTGLSPPNNARNDLKSAEGLKKLGVRVSMHAPATIMASTVFGLFPTMGACMEACGLGAPGGPLASLAGPLLFSTAGQVASVSAGVAGMLGIGGDIPAYLHSLIFLVAAASMWQYTTAGAASVLAINAYAFHYAHMATMLSNCAELRR